MSYSAPALSLSFSGNSIASGPPDPSIAVGESAVVTIENFSIKYYSKSGQAEGSQNLYNFFSGTSVGDPRVVYDSVNDRFVVTSMNFTTPNTLTFAVSKDGNPADGWYFGLIHFPNAASLDYPSLSTDGKASYIQVRAFDAQGGYLGDYLTVVDNGLGTGGVYSGGAPSYTQYFAPTVMQRNDFGEPVAPLGGSTAGQPEFLYEGAGVGSYSGVYFTEIDNPSSGHATFTEHYAAGPGPAAASTGATPSQPGTSQPIVTEGGENAVYANGFLYCVQTYTPASGPDANAVTAHWFKVDATKWTIVDQGDVGGSALGAGVSTYDASIAVDANGDFAINFTASGPNLYAGSYYVVHPAGAAAGTVSAPQTLHAGSASYVIPSGGDNHWGDYERTLSADPANPSSFWMFNEYATSPASGGAGQYGLWLGQLTVAAKPAPADFNGDGQSDILWRNASGDDALWQSNGAGGFTGYGMWGADASWKVAGIADFNGDGKADVLWRSTSGADAIWQSNGAGSFTGLGVWSADPSWQVAGTGDFNGDGKADILWRNASGADAIWQSGGGGVFTAFGAWSPDARWSVAGVGDFNGDGKADILWRNTSGDDVVWQSNGAGGFTAGNILSADTSWSVAGIGDFNGDGKADILWRNTSGADYLYQSNAVGGFTGFSLWSADASWKVAEIVDFNGDRKSDVLWRNASGADAIWQSNGAGGFTAVGVSSADPSWLAQKP